MSNSLAKGLHDVKPEDFEFATQPPKNGVPSAAADGSSDLSHESSHELSEFPLVNESTEYM